MALPGNVLSFILCPLAPRGRSLRGTFRPEPLACGDDQLWRGSSSVSRTKALGKALELLPEVIEEVAALKVPNPSLCVLPSMS